jgi:excisionase family DNA binding protein
MKARRHPMSRFLTVQEVAALAHVTTRTVYEWLKQGKLAGKKIGKRWLFSEADLLAALQAPAEAGKSRGR